MKGFKHLAITNRQHPDWFVCSITPMHLARDRDRANAQIISRTPALWQKYEIREHIKIAKCYGRDAKEPKATVKKPFKVHLTRINA